MLPAERDELAATHGGLIREPHEHGLDERLSVAGNCNDALELPSPAPPNATELRLGQASVQRPLSDMASPYEPARFAIACQNAPISASSESGKPLSLITVMRAP